MKIFAWFTHKGKQIYPKWVSVPLAILGALMLILYIQKRSYSELFTALPFYLAWLGSSIIAWASIWFIYRVTLLLDFHFPWYRNYPKRLGYQLLMGVLGTYFLIFLLAAVYFWCLKTNIFDTVWFSKYIRQIIGMLIILNAAFFFKWQMNWNGKNYQSSLNTPKVPVKTKLEFDKIACVFIHGKNYYWVNFDGVCEAWPYTLKQTVTLLPPALFYFINRGFAVNFNAVVKVKSINKKNIALQLTDAIHNGINKIKSTTTEKSENNEIRVSYAKNAFFKKVYASFLAQKEAE
jgi:hypothetical protein